MFFIVLDGFCKCCWCHWHWLICSVVHHPALALTCLGCLPCTLNIVCSLYKCWDFPSIWHTLRDSYLGLLLTNCMCSQQDEGQESLEEELDVLVLDDEGNQVSYSPVVCPPVTPKMVLRKEVPLCQSCWSDRAWDTCLSHMVPRVLLLWSCPLPGWVQRMIWLSVACCFPACRFAQLCLIPWSSILSLINSLLLFFLYSRRFSTTLPAPYGLIIYYFYFLVVKWTDDFFPFFAGLLCQLPGWLLPL